MGVIKMLEFMNNARKTTIAPVSFKEYKNCFIMGDKYVKVLSFVKYPGLFVEGLIAPLVTNLSYDIDMVIEHTDLDLASALKNEMQHLEDLYEKSTDPQERERLKLKYNNLKGFVERSVKETSSTVNVIINIYVKADTLEELEEKTKKIRADLDNSSIKIKTKAVANLQQDYYRKNSPLFLSNDLSSDENFLNGQPMSSLSAAALWPFIFDTLEDPEGTLIGRELTNGGKIIFNQFLYATHKDLAKMYGRTSGNMIIVGRTGMGKTVLMNLLIFGHIVNHRKIIWIDPENKNWKLTKYIGGSFISFGNSDKIINIFDLKPISSDDENILSHEEMYNTKNAIFNVVEEIKITFRTLWPQLSEDALAMISEITIDTYKSVGITTETKFEYLRPEDYPIFSDFSAVISDKLDIYSQNPSLHSLEIKALNELQMRMRQITGYRDIEGEWGRYFNGTTTIKPEEIERSNMISFGTKGLINISPELQNALLRLVFQFAWSVCLGNREEAVLVVDEEHMFIGVPFLAELLAIIQRRSRKYLTATLTGTQQVNDYCDESIKKHGKAIFDNSTYQVYMNLTKDGINDLSRLITLTEEEKESIERLSPYQGLFVLGNKKIPVQFLATPDELSLIPD